MAKKYYLVSVSWDLDQNLPAPIPSGFLWKAQKQMYLKLEEFPTYGLIFKLALREGASKQGFSVDAVTEVPENFRQPWDGVDVIEPEISEKFKTGPESKIS